VHCQQRFALAFERLKRSVGGDRPAERSAAAEKAAAPLSRFISAMRSRSASATALRMVNTSLDTVAGDVAAEIDHVQADALLFQTFEHAERVQAERSMTRGRHRMRTL
jgi:hypothetical protein